MIYLNIQADYLRKSIPSEKFSECSPTFNPSFSGCSPRSRRKGKGDFNRVSDSTHLCRSVSRVRL